MLKKIICLFCTLFVIQLYADDSKIQNLVLQHRINTKKMEANLAILEKETVELSSKIKRIKVQDTKSSVAVSDMQNKVVQNNKKNTAIVNIIQKEIQVLQKIAQEMTADKTSLETQNQKLQIESQKLTRLLVAQKQIQSEQKKSIGILAREKQVASKNRKKIAIYEKLLAQKWMRVKKIRKAITINNKNVKQIVQKYLTQKQQKQRNDKKIAAAIKKKKDDKKDNKKVAAATKEKKKSRRKRRRLRVPPPPPFKTKRRSRNSKRERKVERRKNISDNAWMALIGSLWFYEKPVTNRQYWESFRGMYYNDDSAKSATVTKVSYQDAQAYAKWAGASLPTFNEAKKMLETSDSQHWMWTKSTYGKEGMHIIYKKGEKPRLLLDNSEHSLVSFCLVKKNVR